MKMRRADLVLAVLLVLTMLAGAVGLWAGLALISDDLESQGEFLDGLGLVIGLGVLALVGVPMTVAAKAVHAVRHGRVNAWKWATGAGLIGLLAGIPFGMFHQPLFAVLVLPLLVAVVAIESREPTR